MHSLRRRHHGNLHLGRTNGLGVHPRSTVLGVPEDITNGLDAAGLFKRSPSGSGAGGSGSSSTATTSTSSASSSTCTPGDRSAKCEKPVSGSTATLPIALGVAIPIVIAIIVFFVLHRRHVRKLRREDANDRHKSLDFGMTGGDGLATTRNKGTPEMGTMNAISTNERGLRTRGMSMDMGSPYLLPPGLQGSRESLHSLSRTMHNAEDPYRPITTFIPNEKNPVSLRRIDDGSSSLTGSSGGTHDGMSQSLMPNAAGMARSSPPAPRQPSPVSPVQPPEPGYRVPRKDSLAPHSGANAPSGSVRGLGTHDSYIDRDGSGMRKSNNYLAALISRSDAPSRGSGEPQVHSSQVVTQAQPPKAEHFDPGKASSPQSEHLPMSKEAWLRQSMAAPIISLPEEPRHYNDKGSHTTQNQSVSSSYTSESAGQGSVPQGLDAPGPSRNVQRRSMGLRPLPPDDPADNPEQRANRIRSFYKEYFEETKNGPVRQPREYQEDYGQEYLSRVARHASDTDEFGMPGPQFAQPMARRAMTPPPRAPPRFRPGPPSTPYMNGFTPRGSRAFSSASSGVGYGVHGGARTRPRQPGPPPEPLRLLPTPHLLKEDSFAIPIGFAPPSSYKERQTGRPDSPLGGMRPYSPSIPAHLPLASSFDDLSVMPSPHALRKSGTFTALDFAPSPRFKGGDANNDTASIRSGRSNNSSMSAAHLHSIRTGAYRVSRLPKDVVGTQNELATALRPTWDMRPDALTGS
ncbi:MAG: hypothetical protein M1816_002933 [Peltula sp. TS41687]|nr:MAG: hypothetical protein M1816_002933 [Peltula sp. TS41687]